MGALRLGVRQPAALVIAALFLMLGPRAADAAGKCGGAGAICKMGKQCCSGVCVGGNPMGKPSGACSGGGNGSPCASDANCTSGHCVNGICCNTACNGQCDASCATGTCAGKTAGTSCDDGNFCSTSSACNGSGACVGSGNPCAGFALCTICLEASDACAFEGTVPCADDGAGCSAAFDCLSNHCVDGVCCDTACTGACEACDSASTGGTDGVCAFVQSGLDPDDECAAVDPGCGTGACDGAGACDLAAATTPCDDGQFCTATDTCDGNGACLGSGNPCTGVCTDCFENPDGCAQEGELCGQPTGETCSSSVHCSSTYCVDGFCCDAPCDAACEACSSAKTGVSNGSCADIPAGSDPDEECFANLEGCASGSCNGFGECEVSPLGTPCDDGFDCSDTDRCDGSGSCQQETSNGCEGSDACNSEGTCTPE